LSANTAIISADEQLSLSGPILNRGRERHVCGLIKTNKNQNEKNIIVVGGNDISGTL